MNDLILLEDSMQSAGAWIPANIIDNKQLNFRQKVIYAAIANTANYRGHCWMSNEYFIEKFGMTKQCFSKDLKTLNGLGCIEVVKVPIDGGTKRLIAIGELDLELDEIIIPEKKETAEDLLIKRLLLDNPNWLRHLPKTVLNKKVTPLEIEWVLQAIDWFNEVRSFNFGKRQGDPTYRRLTPDGKACSQLVERFREDPEILGTWTATLENMFHGGYHIENKWQYLTLEFVSRKTKYDIYYGGGSNTDS